MDVQRHHCFIGDTRGRTRGRYSNQFTTMLAALDHRAQTPQLAWAPTWNTVKHSWLERWIIQNRSSDCKCKARWYEVSHFTVAARQPCPRTNNTIDNLGSHDSDCHREHGNQVHQEYEEDKLNTRTPDHSGRKLCLVVRREGGRKLEGAPARDHSNRSYNYFSQPYPDRHHQHFSAEDGQSYGLKARRESDVRHYRDNSHIRRRLRSLPLDAAVADPTTVHRTPS